jgi:integrase
VTGTTKREVQQKLRELLSNADRGILPSAERLTVAQFLDRWLEDTVKRGLRPSTYSDYRNSVHRHAIPAFGKVQLAKLQPMHLQRLYAEMLDKGLSPKTVGNVHGCLHVALKQALEWGLVPRNVASVVRKPRPRKVPIQVLTEGQVGLLLQAGRGSRQEALVTLALASGMRESELLGLRWGEVDLDRGLVRVTGQLRRDRSIEDTKTPTGNRTIDLPGSAVETLREHRRRQLRERELWGPEWEDNDLVFCTGHPSRLPKSRLNGSGSLPEEQLGVGGAETTYDKRAGRPLGHRNVLRDFTKLLEDAGIPHVDFHALRHTHATLLLLLGTNPKVVQERLGHSSISVTMNIYSHFLPTMGKDAAGRLDRVLSQIAPGLHQGDDGQAPPPTS